MNIKFFALLAAGLLAGCSTTAPRNPNELYLNTSPSKPFILDVDMCSDVDDVCALRVATVLDDAGVIKLEGVAYSVDGYNCIEALRGFLVFDGKKDVLIGKSPVANTDEKSLYWDSLAEYDDGKAEVLDAVKMYRKILAKSKKPVDIITTGFVTNIEYLLKSEPDEYSKLNGLDLVKEKCGQLYVVGGAYPQGGDFNFFYTKESREAIDYVNKNWPFPILYYRNDIGGRMVCGGKIQQIDKDRKDLVTRALWDYGCTNGRVAWDPFSTMIAAYAFSDITKIGYERTDITFNPENGENKFISNPNGRHFVITEPTASDEYFENFLDSLILKKAKL